jgi:hypothetical protein
MIEERNSTVDEHNGGASDGDAQVPLTVVYRQLDDHFSEAEAPYDVGAGLDRLLHWMSEQDVAASRHAESDVAVQMRPDDGGQHARHLAGLWHDLASQSIRTTFRLGVVSLLIVMAVVVGVGLLLTQMSRPSSAEAIAVAASAVAATVATVLVHRTAVRAVQVDRQERLDDVAGTLRQAGLDTGSLWRKEPFLARGRVRADERLASGQRDQEANGGSRGRSSLIRPLATALGGVALGAMTAHGSQLLLASLVVVIVLPTCAVVVPAVWSRNAERRHAALTILRVLLDRPEGRRARPPSRTLPSDDRPRPASTGADAPSTREETLGHRGGWRG